MGLKDFLHRWKNTKPLSFRTTYSATCVEVVGSMGKGSHLKYHSRWSQERSSAQLTQTLTKCSRYGTRQYHLGGTLIEDSDIARLSPSKSHPGLQGRVPAEATQLTPYSSAPCSSPGATSGFLADSTGTALQLKRKLFTFSVKLAFSCINKLDQLAVQLHKHQSQRKGGGREPLSAAVSLSREFSHLM